MCGRSSRIHWPHSVRLVQPVGGDRVALDTQQRVISGSRSVDRSGRSCRMIAAWMSPFSATAVIASSTLVTTRYSIRTSSADCRSDRSRGARSSMPAVTR